MQTFTQMLVTIVFPLPNGKEIRFTGDKEDAEFVTALFRDAEFWRKSQLTEDTAVTEEAARAEVLDAMEDDMPLERALHLAALWSAGKLIGGDAHSAAIALLAEVQRLRVAPRAGPKTAKPNTSEPLI